MDMMALLAGNLLSVLREPKLVKVEVDQDGYKSCTKGWRNAIKNHSMGNWQAAEACMVMMMMVDDDETVG